MKRSTAWNLLRPKVTPKEATKQKNVLNTKQQLHNYYLHESTEASPGENEDGKFVLSY
jgi:hypothetical protein